LLERFLELHLPAQLLLKFKEDFSGQPQLAFDSYPLYIVRME